ncbi:MAG: hypothetical protein LBU58_11950, partial [Clostridiales bacterium]|nr:hypothetical protein [Clostridiales bacterium]
MKRLFVFTLIFALVIGAVPAAAFAADAETNAMPSGQKLFFDGRLVDVAAYDIEGHNYVKLRDICELVNYKITYQTLSSGEFVTCYYTKRNYDRTEDANADAGPPTSAALAKPAEIYAIFNPVRLDLNAADGSGLAAAYKIKAYEINDNNYIQLRDFAARVSEAGVEASEKAIDVRYNPQDDSVQIFSNTVYTGEDIVPSDVEPPYGPQQENSYTDGGAETDVYGAVDQILSQIIKDGMTEDEKVKAVYTCIMYNFTHTGKAETIPEGNKVTYTTPTRSSSGGAYVGRAGTLLTNKNGVCDHFAALFKVMLDRIGIPCEVASGQYVNRDGSKMPHAWNRAQIDGGWY